jgi:hypothetical protein
MRYLTDEQIREEFQRRQREQEQLYAHIMQVLADVRASCEICRSIPEEYAGFDAARRRGMAAIKRRIQGLMARRVKP